MPGGRRAQGPFPGLAVAYGLRQRRRRNCNSHAPLGGAREERNRLAIIPVQRDQSRSVSGVRKIELRRPRRAPFSLAGRCNASLSISLQPAASKRAMVTACFTKAETLVEPPAAISVRTYSSCSPEKAEGSGGLPRTSFAVCHQVRNLDRAKLTKRIGVLPADLLREVEGGLKSAMDLD
jgi:PemK-like, MazF-like toxin of type II toxin-antitoxin system